VASAFKRIIPPDLYCFEPHQPELPSLSPTPSWISLGHGSKSEGNAGNAWAKLSAKLLHRACLAAREPCPPDFRMEDVKYAEALQRTLPWVVKSYDKRRTGSTG